MLGVRNSAGALKSNLGNIFLMVFEPDSQVLFDIVKRGGVAVGLKGDVLRLPLGSDCAERWEKKVKGMGENLGAVRGFVEGLDLKD